MVVRVLAACYSDHPSALGSFERVVRVGLRWVLMFGYCLAVVEVEEGTRPAVELTDEGREGVVAVLLGQRLLVLEAP